MILIFLSTMLACGDKDSAEPESESISQAAPPPPIPEQQSCADLNAQQCFECFANENPVGYNAYIGHVITYCYCGIECTDTCVDFCSTLDGSVQPTQECGTCVDTVGSDQQSQCISDFSEACESDDECVSFARDGNTCPLDTESQ